MNRANDETSILMTNDESTIALTPPPVPSSNKSKIVKGLVALGCVAATVAVAGFKMAGTSSTLSPVDSMTLQSKASLGILLLKGTPMAFSSVMREGYCIGQRTDESNSVSMAIDLCDDRAEDQSFRATMIDSRIRPTKNPRMCWTADRESGLLVLNECDRRNGAQLVSYDTATMMIRIPGAKCLTALDGETRPVLGFAECDDAAQEQKFALAPRTNGNTPPPPPPRPTSPPPPPPIGPWGPFALVARGADGQCLDPRTAGKSIVACKDVTSAQAIRYDGSSLRVMGAQWANRAPVELCVDESSMSFKPCQRVSEQRFKYDDRLDKFRNADVNLCIVKKPEMEAAVLMWCDRNDKL